MPIGAHNLISNSEMIRKAERILSVLEGRMTVQELVDLSGIDKYEIGSAMSVLVQTGRVRRISLKLPNYYPIAYERVNN